MKTGYAGVYLRFNSYGSNKERFLAFAVIKSETKEVKNALGFILIN